MLVENLVICELKAVDETNPVWEQSSIIKSFKIIRKTFGFSH